MASNWTRPYQVRFPLDKKQVEEIDMMFQKLFSKFPLLPERGGTGLSGWAVGDIFYGDEDAADDPIISLLTSVSAGSYLRSGGLLTAPLWSTLKLPNSAAVGDILIASSLDTITGLAIGAAGTVVRSNGTLPANSTFTIPNTFAQGDVIYGSATNVLTALAKDANATRYLSNTGASNNPAWAQVNLTNGTTGTLVVTSGGTGFSAYATGDLLTATSGTTLGRLAIGGSGAFLRSNGSTPTWSTLTLPSTAVAGGILHASATSVGTFLAIGGAGTIVRSTGTLPAYSGFTIPNTVALGDILYGSASNVLTALATSASATRYLSNTGASNIPAWAQVGLTDGVTGILPVANGGTGVSNATQNYTPTLVNVANLDASTAYDCQYYRIGSVVTVTGKVDVDPTLTTTSTQLGISLPIATNLGAAEDCAGTAASPTITQQSAAILGDVANDRAQMQWVALDVTNQPMYFTFSYQVI